MMFFIELVSLPCKKKFDVARELMRGRGRVNLFLRQESESEQPPMNKDMTERRPVSRHGFFPTHLWGYH